MAGEEAPAGGLDPDGPFGSRRWLALHAVLERTLSTPAGGIHHERRQSRQARCAMDKAAALGRASIDAFCRVDGRERHVDCLHLLVTSLALYNDWTWRHWRATGREIGATILDVARECDRDAPQYVLPRDAAREARHG